MADYKITLLKGDGIGPEIVNQAVKVLDCAAEKFGFGVTYDEGLLGGCAIDATGVSAPLLKQLQSVRRLTACFW